MKRRKRATGVNAARYANSAYHTRKSLTFNGITDTLSGWARRLHTYPGAVFGRIKRGWSVEDVLTIPYDGKHRTNTPLYYYDGRMMSLTDIAKNTGINKRTLHGRLAGKSGSYKKKCSTVEEAVAMGKDYKTNRAKLVEYRGCKKPLKEWCRILELDYRVIWSRIHNGGMSAEEALASGKNLRDRLFTVNGESHCLKYWWKLAYDNGITKSPYGTIVVRVAKGEDLFDALTRENMSNKEKVEKLWAKKKSNERARELRSLGILV